MTWLRNFLAVVLFMSTLGAAYAQETECRTAASLDTEYAALDLTDRKIVVERNAHFIKTLVSGLEAMIGKAPFDTSLIDEVRFYDIHSSSFVAFMSKGCSLSTVAIPDVALIQILGREASIE